MSAASPQPQKVRCRQIVEADLGGVCALLTAGFPDRTPHYWRHALARPEDPHRAGRLSPVRLPPRNRRRRCGRAAADLHRDRGQGSLQRVELVCGPNLSPARRRAGLLGAEVQGRHLSERLAGAEHLGRSSRRQGYRRYSEGQFASLPGLSLKGLGARINEYHPARDAARFPAAEVALLDGPPGLRLHGAGGGAEWRNHSPRLPAPRREASRQGDAAGLLPRHPPISPETPAPWAVS